MSDKIKEARNDLTNNIINEFFGPGSEGSDGGDTEHERISENPLKRYAIGILYPQKAFSEVTEIIDEENNDTSLDETDDQESHNEIENEANDVYKGKKLTYEDIDESIDIPVSKANQYSPSSYGISFFVKGQNPSLFIKIECAKYNRLESDQSLVALTPETEFLKEYQEMGWYAIQNNALEYLSRSNAQKARELFGDKYLIFSRIHDKANNFKNKGFKREPLMVFSGVVEIDKQTDPILTKYEKEISIHVKVRRFEDNIRKVTISVVNNLTKDDSSFSVKPEHCYFQNKIIVNSTKESVFVHNSQINLNSSTDLEDDLLYRSRKIFGVGHGCSIEWNHPEIPTEVSSTFIPSYEVPLSNPFPNRISNLHLPVFSMSYLGFNTQRDKILTELTQFVDDYSGWIQDQKRDIDTVDIKYHAAANNIISDCQLAKVRMLDGLSILKSNDRAWQSFQLANQSMVIQRYHTEKYLKTPRDVNSDKPMFIDNYSIVGEDIAKWRPFQLGFFLLSIKSIVDPNSEDRRIADLIWFPTGGGKTEAYLGLISFTIFYRRISRGKAGGGTSVIMRYTLRLLTAQQYERASTLIAACEYLRNKSNGKLGEDKISIGLWVGMANTPNTKAVAEENVALMINKPDEFREKNPFQVICCPWCGTKLFNEQNPSNSGYRSLPKFNFKCIESTCIYSTGLPMQVVDELLYEEPPTLLFATVDKFARIPWEPRSLSYFGKTIEKKKVTTTNLPPDLILQDELHLISGPLGTLFGIYEALIDYLSISNNNPPKIVCSTATIKRADEQIKSLFNRSYFSFPPLGLSITDNYFSTEIPISEKAGRKYLGLIAVGITQTSAQVKALSNLLYNNYFNDYDDLTKDVYYTLVNYFNTIKELGHTASLIDADVHEKIQTLQARFRTIKNRRLLIKELTSREDSKALPLILSQLAKECYPSPKSISILLSTNMFSVGVDISRLNLMFVSGQPKSSSEYIQATSRVGRANPGLVIVMYDGFRPRDRSHYENFKSFHQSFYRFVEPAGVTPFSEPARNRALKALLIGISRLSMNMLDNHDALNFKNHTVDAGFVEFIKTRVSNIDPDELEALTNEIAIYTKDWQERCSEGLIFYRKLNPFNKNKELLENQVPLFKGYEEKYTEQDPDAWLILNSLRSVDSPTVCWLED